MGFKLGKERRKIRTPENSGISNDMPKMGQIIPKDDLGEGITAEANNDGSIFIDSKVRPGSAKYNKAIRHENQHLEDMASGRAQYGDNWVLWEGKIYFRKEIDGKMFIDGPAGRLAEGHPNHPWEKVAIQAEVGGPVPEGYESLHGKIPESKETPEAGESPNKFLKGLRSKIKGAAKTATGAMGGLAGAVFGGKKRGEEEAIERGDCDCGEGEAGGDPRAMAQEAMASAREKMFGGKDAYQKLKQAHEGDDLPPGVISGGGFPGGMFSDRRLKKDIKLVGKSPNGLKIYTFKYIDEMCDNNTYEGVMSDEIPTNAIIKHDSGFDMVDYSQLDVDFKRI